MFTGCGSPDTGGRVSLCCAQPISAYSIRRKMLSFISGPLFNGCSGVSVIATTRYELGCDEGGRDSVQKLILDVIVSSCELKSNLTVGTLPDADSSVVESFYQALFLLPKTLQNHWLNFQLLLMS